MGSLVITPNVKSTLSVPYIVFLLIYLFLPLNEPDLFKKIYHQLHKTKLKKADIHLQPPYSSSIVSPTIFTKPELHPQRHPHVQPATPATIILNVIMERHNIGREGERDRRMRIKRIEKRESGSWVIMERVIWFRVRFTLTSDFGFDSVSGFGDFGADRCWTPTCIHQISGFGFDLRSGFRGFGADRCWTPATKQRRHQKPRSSHRSVEFIGVYFEFM
ncbi:hypothetical protein HanRHA438_Chr02g0090881 [Helianthus annuus]|nr:hypothetical protein HanRHA438_Chr02g0090881 [Helianthus annuus]